MKRKNDPRHLKRIQLMQDLFAWDFNNKSKVSLPTKEIISKIKKIDILIQKSATERPLNQINKIDLAILRLSIFELIMGKGTPPKVVVDEAVELGKEYGSDSSAKFINGALGNLIEQAKIKI